MRPGLRTTGMILLVAVLIALMATYLGKFQLSLLTDIGISALVVSGLVLVSGIGGAISFGQAAFVGIAGYTTAWLTTALDWSPWESVWLALLVTCGSAAILGAITMRLKGHYLALASIAWGLAIPIVFTVIPGLGQHSGIVGIPVVHIGSLSLGTPSGMFVLTWVVLLAGIWFAYNLLHSRVGRCIRSLRGGNVFLGSFGAHAYRLRVTLFVLAAFYAGVAGWLFAHAHRFVSEAPFSLHASINYVFMMFVGGMNQLAGALVGPAVFAELNDRLQDVLPYLTSRGAQINALVFALIFLVLLERLPGGITSPFERILFNRRKARQKGVPLQAKSPVKLERRTLPQRGRTVLRATNIVRRFGGLVAVDHVSFDIKAGEILGLIGPNGAGKSTIFNLLTATLGVTDGSFEFLGSSIRGRSQRDIARLGIARTFQHVKLRPRMSVLENVALGAHARGHCGLLRGGLRMDRREESSIMAEAMRQLARVGLEEHAYERAGSLPLGTQRLVEIARALAADPVLIMLDEPAAGLRLFEKEELAGLLKELREEGVAVLLVEHDMHFVMNLVDKLVVVNFGAKIAEGKPAEVRMNSHVQEAYLGRSKNVEAAAEEVPVPVQSMGSLEPDRDS